MSRVGAMADVMGRGKLVLVALALLAAAQPLAAQERIRAYDTTIQVSADGSIDVTERITVRAEGSEIRRGIYRDFPTRYRDRAGNRVRVDLTVLGVERDGRPEDWFTERRGNGIRINTGGDAYLPTLPGEYTFTLRYRTTRQLGFFAQHDELYWNAIGTGWSFSIESATVDVRLPEAVPVDSMGAEGYTGPQGSQGTAYTAATPAPGTAHYRLTAPLAPHEGFTVVLTFRGGRVAAPTAATRAGWLLQDNAGILVALMGLLVLLAFCVVQWRRVGRDPRAGVIIPRYEPPAGQTPGAMRYLGRMGYDMRCFSADLLALAVGGHVRIHQHRKWRKSRWRLERTVPAGVPVPATSAAAADRPQDLIAAPPPVVRPLLTKLFPGGKLELTLTDKNAATVSSARDAHKKALDASLHPRYFQRNAGRAWLAFGIIAATAFVAFSASGGAGIPAILAILVAMVIIGAIFVPLVRAPTPEGRRLLDEIEGLKLYLSVAERDELASLHAPGEPPQLDAERYEALLPYAVALEVEDAWTARFTAAVGAAAVAVATGRMGWYAGTGRVGDMADFTRSIGSSLTSSIASASSPPGSSSGSGGGGSSGGGGGGGGGGGR